MSRMDVIVGRESKGKTYWTKIGSAWPSDKGGFSITLDALPLPNAEGVCRMLVVEPKPRDEAPAQSNSARAKQARGGANDLEDSIPF